MSITLNVFYSLLSLFACLLRTRLADTNAYSRLLSPFSSRFDDSRYIGTTPWSSFLVGREGLYMLIAHSVYDLVVYTRATSLDSPAFPSRRCRYCVQYLEIVLRGFFVSRKLTGDNERFVIASWLNRAIFPSTLSSGKSESHCRVLNSRAVYKSQRELKSKTDWSVL